jgi:heme/copper-type cytochrome/quinol oxidase subunit 3
MRLSRCIALTLLLSTTGCSFLFVKPTKEPKPRECTSSRAAPIVDTLVGTYELVGAGVAAQSRDEDYEGEELRTRQSDMLFGATLGALFVSSAIYGYVHTADCSKAKSEKRRKRSRKRDTAVMTLGR